MKLCAMCACYTKSQFSDSLSHNMSPLFYLFLALISHSASGDLIPTGLLLGITGQLTKTLTETVETVVQNSPMAMFQGVQSNFDAEPETETDGGQVKVGAGLALVNLAAGNDIKDEVITIARSPTIQNQASNREAGGDKVIEQEEEIQEDGKKSPQEKDEKKEEKDQPSTPPTSDTSAGVIQLQKAVQQNQKRK